MQRPCGKIRVCAVCRAKWGRSWSWVLRENLSLVGCKTRMVTITAPGVDVLPWDEDHCRWQGAHTHSGPAGCRIDLGAAAAWRVDLEQRFHRLTMAARKRARVHEPVIAALAWEVQERGAPHCHIVTTVTRAGEAFVTALMEMAPAYGFGTIRDDGYASKGAYAHAAYLGKYMTKHDATVEEQRRRAVYEAALLPKRPVWVSPILTQRSGATMQVARLMRSLWAFAEGYRERPPTYRSGIEAAWVMYWRRVDRRGRANVRRSIVPRDLGTYEPWNAVSWPGEVWSARSTQEQTPMASSECAGDSW